jgi:predicted amidophosphoribosyltransferase
MKILSDGVVYECQRCGETDVDPETHDCGAELPFDGDVCPMCGERYDNYLNHLSDCDP